MTPPPRAVLDAIDQAYRLLPVAMDSRSARVLQLAIGYQESMFRHRRQLVGRPPRPVGPAAGFWQFEPAGIAGVLRHRASRFWAFDLCGRRSVAPKPAPVWAALLEDDVLAAGFARLLLFTHPKRLPTEAAPAWEYYLTLWRPGKPKPATWEGYFAYAKTLVPLAS